MRILAALALAVAASLAPVSSASADVQLTIANGQVSLVAKDATVRQILAEWAKVGQTTIINAERITGGPVTLQLTDVPEEQALDVLLRSVSGYMAAPRAPATAGVSRFDRILVMPTSTPPRAVATAPPPAFARPPLTPLVQQPANDDGDDDRPAPNVVPDPRAPTFNPFPPPQVASPQQGGPAVVPPQGSVPQGGGPYTTPTQLYPTPTVPAGVATPGMIVQPPAEPGQQQPGQPVPVQQQRPQG
jgi:hypothetical protein